MLTVQYDVYAGILRQVYSQMVHRGEQDSRGRTDQEVIARRDLRREDL